MREMAACGSFLLRQDYQGRGLELVWPAAEEGGEFWVVPNPDWVGYSVVRADDRWLSPSTTGRP
jgi:hypothetical protein